MTIQRVDVFPGNPLPFLYVSICPECGEQSITPSNSPFDRPVLMCPCRIDKMVDEEIAAYERMVDEAIAAYERGETVSLRDVMDEE